MTNVYRAISIDISRLLLGAPGRNYDRVMDVDIERLERRCFSKESITRIITTGSVAPASQAEYVNRVWHYTNAEFVRWTTLDDPDPTGVSYPGPGTFGVDTTTPAVVESWTPA